MSNGKVVKVSGPLVVATGLAEANMAAGIILLM